MANRKRGSLVITDSLGSLLPHNFTFPSKGEEEESKALQDARGPNPSLLHATVDAHTEMEPEVVQWHRCTPVSDCTKGAARGT